jgi:hypothetical protein
MANAITSTATAAPAAIETQGVRRAGLRAEEEGRGPGV